jgi:hypothetical protein
MLLESAVYVEEETENPADAVELQSLLTIATDDIDEVVGLLRQDEDDMDAEETDAVQEE